MPVQGLFYIVSTKLLINHLATKPVGHSYFYIYKNIMERLRNLIRNHDFINEEHFIWTFIGFFYTFGVLNIEAMFIFVGNVTSQNSL